MTPGSSNPTLSTPPITTPKRPAKSTEYATQVQTGRRRSQTSQTRQAPSSDMGRLFQKRGDTLRMSAASVQLWKTEFANGRPGGLLEGGADYQVFAATAVQSRDGAMTISPYCWRASTA